MRRSLSLTLIAVTIFVIFWIPLASIRGATEARFDRLTGRYRIQDYGGLEPWHESYVQTMQQEFGVKVDTVAGCIVSGWFIRYVRSYNDVMEAALVKKYGRDVARESRIRAAEDWKRTHPRQLTD